MDIISAERIVDRRVRRESKKMESKVKKFRKEASRRASMANKRLDRLEKAGMTSSPAYQKWASGGKKRFGIRGMDFNETQSEMARINEYLDSATSSITGAKKVLSELSKNTGMKMNYKDWDKANKQASEFFDVASKVEQYLRTVEDRASAVGYQRIWEAVSSYVDEANIALGEATTDVDRIVKDIVKAMDVYDEEEVEKMGNLSPRMPGSGLAKAAYLDKREKK